MAAARTAEFACSAALDGQEFFGLVAARKEVSLIGQTSGVEEFESILDILARRTSGRYPPGPDHWAASGMCLFSRRAPWIVKVSSLSPSSHTITASKHKLAALFPIPGATVKKFPALTPNDLAVVLQITVGDLRLLLGADLERGQDERRGWRAIVRAKSKTGELNHVYKVAHHGSADGDLDEIWSELLVGDCHALVTPYARGPSPRPSSTDVERIKSKTPNVYCTAVPSQPPARGKLVDKTMREVTLHRRALRRSPGHIRLRIPIDEPQIDVAVELFDGAVRL